MNPLTNVRNIVNLSKQELERGGGGKSWHDQYKDSAWIFIGGLPFDLTEGDVLGVFSQYGEIVNLNLIRDKSTGKSKGFGFICYEDQRSTVLAVDNLNSIKLLGRTIRVDHVSEYRLPKDLEKYDPEQRQLMVEGCAPKPELVNPEPVKAEPPKTEEPQESSLKRKSKKSKKEKKKKDKKRKKKRRDHSSSSESESSS